KRHSNGLRFSVATNVKREQTLEKIVGQALYVKCQLIISRDVLLISRARFRKALINHQNRRR
ncbi:hypothetical protein, partial [Pseudomonas avellanae]|uniref:hypothetical protein n=1 Tax=Pseudomonas avellanae TaxID=46257 RepID=UPI0019D32B06